MSRYENKKKDINVQMDIQNRKIDSTSQRSNLSQDKPDTTNKVSHSPLKHIRRCNYLLCWARELPWLQKWIWNLWNIHSNSTELLNKQKNRIHRLKSISQFHNLSSEYSVLRFNLQILIHVHIDLHLNLVVFFLDKSNLIYSLIEVLLLPQARSPSGIPGNEKETSYLPSMKPN
ncbi:hypothetical protein M5K25_001598 [Dendrobium thyrsiflorum]|uniref:Uncharacterized protein n=1 Tax=Dendrobium thyrsiflorum TaxID=117978 RepID=A0ABD0VQS4_DENTH